MLTERQHGAPTSAPDHPQCLRCGRSLRTPKYRQIGYGPICLTKAGQALAEASGGADVCDLPYDRTTGDVVCQRDATNLFQVHVNVPLLDGKTKQGGFEWGYEGTGPANFALNILLHHGVPARDALRWFQDFKRAFVATLPREGGTIPGAAIRAWVAARCTETASAA